MYKRKRLIVVLVLIIIQVLFSGISNNKDNNKVNVEQLKATLQEINNMCNSVYDDVESSEKKYLQLLEDEKDPLKRGMYASTLLQVNAIKGEPDEIVKYAEIAVESYLQVDGGVYYAISEYKYLAWSMYSTSRYSESFKAAQKVIELLSLDKEKIFTESEIIETEALVDSIFLLIYSEFEILDRAKVHYDKLVDIEITKELEFTQGEKITTSKMKYAYAIKDYDLMKKYAEQIHEISIRNNALKNVSTSDAVLMDVAKANIKIGNLEEAFNQMQIAEKRVEEMKSYQSLAEIQSMYGEYYDKLGDYDNALLYYKKGIDMYMDIQGYMKIRGISKSILEMAKRYDKEKEVMNYYSYIYEIDNMLGGDELIKDVFRESININDSFNIYRLEYLESKSNTIKKTGYIFILVIIIVSIFLIKISILIAKTNKSKRALQEVINKDYLTEAYTRNYGYNFIENLIVDKVEFSIGILDLDNFKMMNDKYGHMFGDEILKRLVSVIKINLDDGDIIIRCGGEEFIVVFIDTTKDEAKEKLEKIRIILNKIEFTNAVKASFSAGICQCNNYTFSKLIKEADKLLYKAKEEGKNRVCL